MLPDEDQQKVITEYYTDITTYIDEMQINFITGKESLDNFDAFRDKLRELGVEELTATYQEIYDRSK